MVTLWNLMDVRCGMNLEIRNQWLYTTDSDRLSQWEMANFDPVHNPSSSIDCKKIVTVDYVRKTKCYANLGANPSTGGFWANG